MYSAWVGVGLGRGWPGLGVMAWVGVAREVIYCDFDLVLPWGLSASNGDVSCDTKSVLDWNTES